MKSFRRPDWYVLIGLALVVLSVVLSSVHYAVFRDRSRIFDWILGSLAFVPIQVLLVTLFMERLLEERERTRVLDKLNMVVGAFYDELGMSLLRTTLMCDPKAKDLVDALRVSDQWADHAFLESRKIAGRHRYAFEADPDVWERVRDLLRSKRDFLLRLLENPNLLEHESFTELIRATFHLTDELSYRQKLDSLPRSDYEHLSKDVVRVYQHLVSHWLDYMKYLKREYPYLFSLAVRTNPFDPNASAVIRD